MSKYLVTLEIESDTLPTFEVEGWQVIHTEGVEE